jgi:hypothetical protein
MWRIRYIIIVITNTNTNDHSFDVIRFNTYKIKNDLLVSSSKKSLF